ncbi:conserved exported hypothetical protein [Candidatus Nitrospira nitrosa]|uniref:Uncharacterized protein n=1 Tax=Candidatus Nitrospira nitrosa TaxID=1742972 RepID=A0A0S4LJ76_9BACT|nr:hypothetical protein [Candidatus Nitrospira nitrosa]CUS37557.1 conserved exported hypothetical protein [Candidatus Nitrospira nitrosa]
MAMPDRELRTEMRLIAFLIGSLLVLCASVVQAFSALAEESVLAFAVVNEIPKDRTRVSAKVAVEGTVADMTLLASDQILSNLAWKQLELCHALKLEGYKTSEGFLVQTVRAIDGAMLPMVLQGFEGDCLLKKALEVAPFVD